MPAFDLERGFTLLEAIVALAIVALVVSAALRLFTAGSQETARAGEAAALARIAESVLERADLDLAGDAEQSGEIAGLRWRLEREPFAEETQEEAGRNPARAPRLVRVRAIVEDGRGGRFELATLRFAAQP